MTGKDGTSRSKGAATGRVFGSRLGVVDVPGSRLSVRVGQAKRREASCLGFAIVDSEGLGLGFRIVQTAS